jgi:hypothetical protein
MIKESAHMVMRRRTRRQRTRRRRVQKGGAENHTVVMIEPRKGKQKAVEFILRNALILPSEWSILFFYGTGNKESVEKFVGTLNAVEKARITLKPLGVANLTEKEYNRLMMSRTILDQIPTEVFLVMQTDSLICREGLQHLPDFIKYDYVGAPWKGHNIVGNGGFSLRRKTKMLEVLEKCSELIEKNNEDGFFSGGCDAAKVNKPNAKEAEKFAVETEYTGQQPFGVHKAWAHVRHRHAELEGQCAEYKKLKEINMG